MRQMTPKAYNIVVDLHKVFQERHTLVITLGQSIDIGHFISIMMESEGNWNMVDGFVRKIFEFKGGELKS